MDSAFSVSYAVSCLIPFLCLSRIGHKRPVVSIQPYLPAVHKVPIGIYPILLSAYVVSQLDTCPHPFLGCCQCAERFALLGGIVIDDTLCHGDCCYDGRQPFTTAHRVILLIIYEDDVRSDVLQLSPEYVVGLDFVRVSNSVLIVLTE